MAQNSFFDFSGSPIRTLRTYKTLFELTAETLRYNTNWLDISGSNLFSNSNNFDSSNWEKLNITISSSVVLLPDGSYSSGNVLKETSDSNPTLHTLYQTKSLTTGCKYFISGIIQSSSRTWTAVYILDKTTNQKHGFFVNLSSGAIGSEISGGTVTAKEVIVRPNGGWMVNLTFIAQNTGAHDICYSPASDDNQLSFTGSGGDSIVVTRPFILDITDSLATHALREYTETGNYIKESMNFTKYGDPVLVETNLASHGGTYRSAIQFDGIDDYFQYSAGMLDTAVFASDHTISVCLTTDSTQTASISNIFRCCSSPANGFILTYNKSSGYLVASYYNNGSDSSLSTLVSNTNLPYHVFIIRKDNVGYLYLNGNLVDTKSLSGYGTSTDSASIRIGVDNDSGSFFKGQFLYLRFDCTAITAKNRQQETKYFQGFLQYEANQVQTPIDFSRSGSIDRLSKIDGSDFSLPANTLKIGNTNRITNFIEQSSDLTDDAWSTDGSTVGTYSGLDPDGTNNAFELIEDTNLYEFDSANKLNSGDAVLGLNSSLEYVDSRYIGGSGMLNDSGTYRMWHAGRGFDSNYFATSITRLNSSDAVLSKGDSGKFDEKSVLGASVLSDSGTYRSWYVGQGFEGNSHFLAPLTKANSGNAVFDVGASDKFDSQSINSANIINDSGTYRMFYSGKGYEGTTNPLVPITRQSSGNAVLDLGTDKFDSKNIMSHDVINDSGTFRMFYIGEGFEADSNFMFPVQRQNGGNQILDIGASGWSITNVYHPSVVYLDGTYHMWYVGDAGGASKIGYATSTDKITWTKQNSNRYVLQGSAGKFDSNGVQAPCVIRDGSIWRMWYGGYDGTNWRIGYALSFDGINWIKQNSGNSVLGLGAGGTWEDYFVTYPSVIKDGSTYKMWYGGHDGSGFAGIGYATSSDGVTWSKSGSNPVLTKSTNSTKFDYTEIACPSVIKDGSTYHMLYAGALSGYWRMGYATSTDGTTWTKQNSENPILYLGSNGKFDDYFACVCSFVKEDSTFYIWYSGYSGSIWKIGYFKMNSNSLMGWKRQNSGNAVLSGSSSKFDQDSVLFPTVINDSGTYRMWYNGQLSGVEAIGYATSSNGIDWTKQNSGNAVLTVGAGGQWDDKDVQAPCVIKDGTTYKMWYSGKSNANSNWQIGYATSSDGITWSKSGIVLAPDGTGFDSTMTYSPCVIKDGTTYKMWYAGYSGSVWAIGYATSSNGITWSRNSSAVLNIGTSGQFDDVQVDSARVVKVDSTYYMIYTAYDGSVFRMGYATSSDGTTWTKQDSGQEGVFQVFDLGVNGKFDDAHVCWSCLLNDTDGWKMWYTGFDGVATWKIGYTTAFGETRLNSGNPVLDIGSAGKFDNLHAQAGSVVLDSSTYRMWYSGHDGTTWKIGYTTSSDKITWTKQNSGDAVLSVSGGQFDSTHVWYPSVIKDGSTFKMWYSGFNGTNWRIGYATSTDGITWTKNGSAVVGLGNSGEFDDAHAYQPTVIKDGSTYRMWYIGYKTSDGIQRLGYATSSNGTTWTKYNTTGVMTVGSSGKFDDAGIEGPCVIKVSSTFILLYSGNDGANYRIGCATSTDGYTWTKQNSGNTILDLNTNQFDSTHVYCPSIILDETNKKLHVFYSGSDGTNNRIGYTTANVYNKRIGYATSTNGTTWSKQNSGNSVLTLGASTKFDQYGIEAVSVIKDGSTYRMWYAGLNECLWQWNAEPSGPSSRTYSAWAYDSVRAEFVLFGGESGGTYYNDTWTYSVANGWTQKSPTHSPSTRSRHVMVFDTERSEIVMFGGYAGSSPKQETWTWNGSDWTQESPISSPSGRFFASMVYDTDRKLVVLFGGTDSSYPNGLQDVWEWSGSDWTSRGNSGYYRWGHSGTYDTARKCVVFFGGQHNGTNYNKTLVWNGNAIQDLTPASNNPDTRYHAVFVYDPNRQVCVLGCGSNDTWEWNGRSWTQISSIDIEINISNTYSWDPVQQKIVAVCFHDGYGNKCSFMTYNPDGRIAAIGYATSSDGITWTRQNSSNAVLSTLSYYGKWDGSSVSYPSVIKDGSTYKIWYSGYNGTRYRVGYATSSDGITWTKSGSTPVVDIAVGKFDSHDVFAPSVVKDNSLYYITYTGYNSTDYTIGYATSSDGITWTKQNSGNYVLGLGTSTKFDDDDVGFCRFLLVSGVASLFYGGYDGANWRVGYATGNQYNNRVGYATSTDKTTWTRQNSSNPVLNLGSSGKFDDFGLEDIAVIKDDSTYRAWYTGTCIADSKLRIGYATSSDGVTWSRQNSGDAVLSPGTATTWDDEKVAQVSVYKDGSTYKMWYSGYDGSTWKIGYASSSDGIIWSKSGSNPVLSGTTGKFDAIGVHSPCVQKYGSTWIMLYTGISSSNVESVGYATSTDGISWTKLNSGDNIFSLGGAEKFDYYSASFPIIVLLTSSCEIFYRGTSVSGGTGKIGYLTANLLNNRIGYATSSNKTTWTKQNSSNAVLTLGVAGKFDEFGLEDVCVIKDSSTYKAWYSGTSLQDNKKKIGYATSSDGITWTRQNSSNPVLQGTTSQWDEYGVCQPCIIKDGSAYKCWYSGYDSSKWRIGYAESSDGITWTKYGSSAVLNIGTTGQFDVNGVSRPWVTKNSTTNIYLMTYVGKNGSNNYTVGYAVSLDGVTWTKCNSNTAIITTGTSGKFDESQITGAPFTISSIGEIDIYHQGLNSSGVGAVGLISTSAFDSGIVYETSSNLLSWSRQNSGVSVLRPGTPGKFDEFRIEATCVIKDDSTYRMWYSGLNIAGYRQIGYATSLDGITWTKQNSGNAVLTVGAGGQWDDAYATYPCVIKDGLTYKMWYSGYKAADNTWRIGYATSSDGITWTKSGSNPVLVGTSGKFDESRVSVPFVQKSNDLYVMLYAGKSPATNLALGVAVSEDGVIWTKRNSGNAILVNGSTGKFDFGGIYWPSFAMSDTDIDCVYTGFTSGGIGTIGLAEIALEDEVSAHELTQLVQRLAPRSYTLSVKVKPDAQTQFRLQIGDQYTDYDMLTLQATGTSGLKNYRITVDNNGFYKLQQTFDLVNVASPHTISFSAMKDGEKNYTSTGERALILYHPQLEEGDVISSYLENQEALPESPYTQNSGDFFGLTLNRGIYNYSLYSEDFTQTNWVKTGATIESVTNPDLPTYALKENSESGEHRIKQDITLSTSTSYTFWAECGFQERSWVYLGIGKTGQSISKYGYFDLARLEVGSTNDSNAKIEFIQQNRYRISITVTTDSTTTWTIYTNAATGNNTKEFQGQNQQSILLYRTQVNVGLISGTYAKTEGTIQTTGSDIIQFLPYKLSKDIFSTDIIPMFEYNFGKPSIDTQVSDDLTNYPLHMHGSTNLMRETEAEGTYYQYSGISYQDIHSNTGGSDFNLESSGDNANFSIVAVIAPDTVSGQHGIIGKWDATAAERSWVLRQDGTSSSFLIAKNGTDQQSSCVKTSALTIQKPTLIIVTYQFVTDGTSIMKNYIDDQEPQITTDARGPIYIGTTAAVQVGAYNNDNFFSGKIYKISFIKGRVLSQSEVSNIYNSLKQIGILPTQVGETMIHKQLDACIMAKVPFASSLTAEETTLFDILGNFGNADTTHNRVFGKLLATGVIELGVYDSAGTLHKATSTTDPIFFNQFHEYKFTFDFSNFANSQAYVDNVSSIFTTWTGNTGTGSIDFRHTMILLGRNLTSNQQRDCIIKWIKTEAK